MPRLLLSSCSASLNRLGRVLSGLREMDGGGRSGPGSEEEEGSEYEGGFLPRSAGKGLMMDSARHVTGCS
jgi:hypothetical protein